MSRTSGGFAFGTKDGSYLETIVECSESGGSTKGSTATEEGSTATEEGSTATEEDVLEVKAKYDTVAAEAKREMLEICELLKKMETGTATRSERDRMVSLNRKLSKMKKEVEATKHEASTAERRMLEESTRKKEVELATVIKKKEVRSIIRSVCATEHVDLAFVVDCTGSMASHIASVKENIKKVVQQVIKTNGNLKIRLAFVCYRDFCDGTDQFEVLDFVSSVERFEAFVEGLAAKGGGDAPEDMAGSIKKANGLSWEYPTRVTFLVADAPCHGSKFHSFSDDYPSGSPGLNIVSELKELIGSNEGGSMSVYFARITEHTNTMLNSFERGGMALQVVDIADVGSLTVSVTKGV